MRLTILGSGYMMPSTGRRPSGFLLEHDGVRLLLDCGHTTVASLVEKGIDLHSIDGLLITHFHTDHFSDVLPFIHARSVDDDAEKRPHKELICIGPKSLEERYRTLRTVMWPEPGQEYPIAFHEYTAGNGPLTVGPFTIAQFTTAHVPWFASAGFRISAGGRTFVYPGDIGAQQEDEFEEGVRGADLLLIEAGTDVRSPSHYMPQQVIALAEKCSVRRTLITHVRVQRVEGVKKAIERNPDITLAEDGMEVEV